LLVTHIITSSSPTILADVFVDGHFSHDGCKLTTAFLSMQVKYDRGSVSNRNFHRTTSLYPQAEVCLNDTIHKGFRAPQPLIQLVPEQSILGN